LEPLVQCFQTADSLEGFSTILASSLTSTRGESSVFLAGAFLDTTALTFLACAFLGTTTAFTFGLSCFLDLAGGASVIKLEDVLIIKKYLH